MRDGSPAPRSGRRWKTGPVMPTFPGLPYHRHRYSVRNGALLGVEVVEDPIEETDRLAVFLDQDALIDAMEASELLL